MWTHFPEEHTEGCEDQGFAITASDFFNRITVATLDSESQGLMPQPKTTCWALPSQNQGS